MVDTVRRSSVYKHHKQALCAVGLADTYHIIHIVRTEPPFLLHGLYHRVRPINIDRSASDSFHDFGAA